MNHTINVLKPSLHLLYNIMEKKGEVYKKKPNKILHRNLSETVNTRPAYTAHKFQRLPLIFCFWNKSPNSFVLEFQKLLQCMQAFRSHTSQIVLYFYRGGWTCVMPMWDVMWHWLHASQNTSIIPPRQTTELYMLYELRVWWQCRLDLVLTTREPYSTVYMS